MQKIYRGWLHFISNGEEDEILSVVGDDGDGYAGDDALASQIADDIEDHGHYLSVRYVTATSAIPERGVYEMVLTTLYGEGQALYQAAYSEITGYLWTDEDLMVGGHDLLAELKSHLGRFLHLEIDYHVEPRHPLN